MLPESCARAFDRWLKEVNPTPDVVSCLQQRAFPAIAMMPGEPAASAPLGTSRFGGAPDLPEGTKWPMANWGNGGNFMTFLAQIELSDVPGNTGLPPQGLLLFFFDSEEQRTEVIFARTGQTLRRCLPPDGTEPATWISDWQRLYPPGTTLLMFEPISITFIPSFVFDYDESLDYAYPSKKELEFINKAPDFDNYLFGWPPSFTSHDGSEFYPQDMVPAFQSNSWLYINQNLTVEKAVELGVDGEQLTALTDWQEHKVHCREEIRKWRTLAHIGPCREANMCIGDAEAVLFLIHDSDLNNENFSNVQGGLKDYS